MSIKNLVGMRTLKTGIAVIISSYLGQTILVSNPFYAIMGTILTMQNTVKNSFTIGKNRIFGTIIGAMVGFVFASIARMIESRIGLQIDTPIYIGLAIICTIIACNALKLSASIVIALTVCFSILVGDSGSGAQLFTYATLRTIDTSIGISVSLLVNYYILQPNYLGSLTEEIEKVEFITTDIVKNILVHKDLDLEILNSELTRLNEIYQNYSADRKYTKNPVSSKKLKDVIDSCYFIYFHAKCIVKLEENPETTELNDVNRSKIVDFFADSNEKEIELVAPIHPIFEYHIHEMLNHLQFLMLSIDELTEHLENE